MVKWSEPAKLKRIILHTPFMPEKDPLNQTPEQNARETIGQLMCLSDSKTPLRIQADSYLGFHKRAIPFFAKYFIMVVL